MIVRNSFPIPEDPPAVPEQLLDKIHDAMRDGLAEVDIMRAQATGWMVVNNIRLEDKDTPTQIAEMVVRCGDRDAETRAVSSKYRAQMWLGDGKARDAIRRYCTFSVIVAGDEPEGGGTRVSSEWKQVYEQQSVLIDKLTDLNLSLIDRNVERAKEDGELARDVHHVIQGMVTPYREGVALKNDAIMSVLQARFKAEQEVSKARAILEKEGEEDAFWRHMSPMVYAAMGQVASKLGMEMPALPPANEKKAAAKQQKAPAGQKSAENSRPLHAQGRILLNGLDASTFMALTDALTLDQREAVRVIASSQDDRTSAQAILTLMNSLMQDMGALMKLNTILGGDRVKAMRQLAAAAKTVAAA